MEHKECADILAELLFAYVNKDKDLPHTFEIHAVEKTVHYLKRNYNGKKFNREWFEQRLKELKSHYN